ncbi:I78 family peptidase inhibitor [Candidatus Viadribacter manganicus]|nr:I78 family peptidase inhibitor [Candidatus Viadribacter manganicus]
MRKFILIASCALALAACGQTTTPPATIETPVAETPAAPTNAAEATAQDTCGAAAHQALIGTPASAIDLATLPAGARIVTPETMVTQDFVATRLNITTNTDGNVASLNCY